MDKYKTVIAYFVNVANHPMAEWDEIINFYKKQANLEEEKGVKHIFLPVRRDLDTPIQMLHYSTL